MARNLATTKYPVRFADRRAVCAAFGRRGIGAAAAAQSIGPGNGSRGGSTPHIA